MAETIIVSDIHVSDGSAYSWFHPEGSKTAIETLHEIATRPNVAELILLGDIFDLWLYPIDVKPLTISEIVDRNPEFSDALRACVRKLPAVYYVNGNHDMDVSIDDLAPFSVDGKSILSLPETGFGSGRRLEHGHEADLFNAKDDSADTIGGYPLGYFVTRISASAKSYEAFTAAKNAAFMKFHADSKAHIAPFTEQTNNIENSKHTVLGSALVNALIDVLVIEANRARAQYGEPPITNDTPIRFATASLDGNVTLRDVRAKYHSLLSRGIAEWGRHIFDAMLTSVKPDGLDWYAKKLCTSSNPPSVLVMGHTHHSEILPHTTYANDGCCCSQSSISYVIVESEKPRVQLIPIPK